MTAIFQLSLVLAVAATCVHAASVKTCDPPCGANAKCNLTLMPQWGVCVCDPGYDKPYGVCKKIIHCTSVDVCPDNEYCGSEGICESPCTSSCPMDIGCLVKGHVAECIYDPDELYGPSGSN